MRFKELSFKCECQHTLHRVDFVIYDKDECGITVMVDTASFWYRLKAAFKHVFFGQKIFVGDLIIDEKKIEELRDFLKEENRSNPLE